MAAALLLSFGHGYSAAAFAASLPSDWTVLGTTRSREKAAAFAQAGVTPVDWNDTASVADAIGRASHILVSVPPDADGDPVLQQFGQELAAAENLAWVGYLSTTGVYGDRGGDWVDEESALEPVNTRSRHRVAAERAWLGTGLPVHLFRLAGIYGPGRSALDRVRAGRAQRIIKPGQVFSRIHVEDIAQGLAASVARPDPGRTYNLADDLPAPPQDVIAFAANLLEMPVPPDIPFETATLSPMARSFYAESKRVSNQRLKNELRVTLRHPDYRSGLRAIHNATAQEQGCNN